MHFNGVAPANKRPALQGSHVQMATTALERQLCAIKGHSCAHLPGPRAPLTAGCRAPPEAAAASRDARGVGTPAWQRPRRRRQAWWRMRHPARLTAAGRRKGWVSAWRVEVKGSKCSTVESLRRIQRPGTQTHETQHGQPGLALMHAATVQVGQPARPAFSEGITAAALLNRTEPCAPPPPPTCSSCAAAVATSCRPSSAASASGWQKQSSRVARPRACTGSEDTLRAPAWGVGAGPARACS